MERIQQRKITRTRELRACIECRRRKLKCDRQFPCDSCARRNEPKSCAYERNFGGPQSEHGRRLQAEAKLQHLEQLVQELSQSRQTFANHDESNHGVNKVPLGKDEMTTNSFYNGATHWSAMLEDIEELRTTIREPEDVNGGNIDAYSDDGDGIGILFGATTPLSFQQILFQFLPQKHEADRLVATYFKAKALAAPFLHSAHFNKRYRLFWNYPSAASPLWTSILFSILDIATRTLSSCPAASLGKHNKANQFAIAAAHCLAAGEYNRPKQDTVEALLLYAQSRCLTSVDMTSDLAILFSTLTRLATMLGYNKEAGEALQGISAFEGEMRRRTWSMCMQLDMFVSFQLGLPSNIRSETWNTNPPTNLLDSDFNDDTVQLPPARPVSEPTELLFYIAKHKLMADFAKIIKHTLSATMRPRDELEILDRELRDTYAALPETFHPRPMAESIVDSPSIIVTRLCVFSIYLKCLCVLHRRYVTRGRHDSIQVCYESATDLVGRLLDVYKEFEPGGQLETQRWFMGSITWHDFLLGCTALCLTVCSTRQFDLGVVDVVRSLKLLQSAKAVCEEQSVKSSDTRKVRKLIEATILSFSDQVNGPIPVTQVTLYTSEDVVFDANREPLSSFHGDKDWPWDESTMPPLPVNDIEWSYMEQFLDLPKDDLMTDT